MSVAIQKAFGQSELQEELQQISAIAYEFKVGWLRNACQELNMKPEQKILESYIAEVKKRGSYDSLTFTQKETILGIQKSVFEVSGENLRLHQELSDALFWLESEEFQSFFHKASKKSVKEFVKKARRCLKRYKEMYPQTPLVKK